MARTPARKAAAPTPPRPGASGPGPARPERTARNALVILAVIASAGALYWMRGILTPLALAVFLAIMIDSFARRLEHHWPRLPDSLSLAVAIVLSLVIFGVTLVVVADRAGGFIGQLVGYGPKIDGLIARLAGMVGAQTPPPVTQMVDDFNPTKYVAQVAQGLQGIVSDAVFVLIYLGFIIASRRGFKRKIVALFPHNTDRTNALEIFNRIRFGVERYLWVQTITGLMIAGGSWLAMLVVGLDNALFWAFLIFLASYIPIIGGFIGIVFPALFGLVQFDTLWQGFVLLGVLYGIQFVVGNIITPRMQGDSLNIDPVVVLLALALWGAIWGLPGMFLSTPLAVMVMIILAEFDGSRWIAIMMSENGDPQGIDDEGHHRRSDRRYGKSEHTS
jgi:predicted PurR-regulated permease PerM